MFINVETIKPKYPYTEWEVIEEGFLIENNYLNETIFMQGNGFIGTRGTFEEGLESEEKLGLEGNFINGFYESEKIRFGELAHAFPEKSQTMLNVSNAKYIKIYIDDEEFNLTTGELEEYKRILNLRDAVLKRSLIWVSPKGKKIKVEAIRLVSLVNKHLMVIRLDILPLNFSGNIRIVSVIDGDVENSTTETNARIDYGPYGRVLMSEQSVVDKEIATLQQRTKNTKHLMACSILNKLESDDSYEVKKIDEEYRAGSEYKVKAKEGKHIKLEKYIAYATSLEYEESKLMNITVDIAKKASNEGFEKVCKEQKAFMDSFWENGDIVIKGDPALQQGIRFNLFQLLQSTGRDGKTSIGAKGLSGEGYEGHIFWDTEMYMLPCYLYTQPEIARKLLEFRYNTLDSARERAREMAHPKGALFPWRTINGKEASCYYPQGTAQYHINADIAFAVNKYIEVANDEEFLINMGAEMLFETARLWANLGDYIETRGKKFCINDVTGPDEYTSIVNNNCYTNMMAAENMLNAYKWAFWLKENRKEDYDRIAAKIGLEDIELVQWKNAAENMYIPFETETKIYAQDDSFLYKKPWDIANTPQDKYPLLEHFHPLVVYRHQVCKQADLVLALYLLGNKFSGEEKKINFDFYEKVTIHESSLSFCIFSIVASDIGYRQKAYDYFMGSSRLDLDDYHRNTKAGIHTANMGGTWMCIVDGFAGMRQYNGTLSFKPYLPEKWEEYSFNITFRGRVLKVTVGKQDTKYCLLKGDDLVILHNGEKRLLKV